MQHVGPTIGCEADYCAAQRSMTERVPHRAGWPPILEEHVARSVFVDVVDAAGAVPHVVVWNRGCT
jgi:hypothetical protein